MDVLFLVQQVCDVLCNVEFGQLFEFWHVFESSARHVGQIAHSQRSQLRATARNIALVRDQKKKPFLELGTYIFLTMCFKLFSVKNTELEISREFSAVNF